MKRTLKSVRIVLNETKIKREGKYKLEDLYAYLDEAAKKAKLHKKDKHTYYADRNENDVARLMIFSYNNVAKNKAIMGNLKEFVHLKDDEIDSDVIAEINEYKGIKSKKKSPPKPKKLNEIEDDKEFKKCKKWFDIILKDATKTQEKELKDFFIKRGYKKNKFGYYESKEELDKDQVETFVKEIGAVLPWLRLCVEKFAVLDAPKETYSLMELVHHHLKDK